MEKNGYLYMLKTEAVFWQRLPVSFPERPIT